MTRRTLSFGRILIIASAAVLLSAAQGQAAAPRSGSSPGGFRHGGHHHGGHHHHHGFHHGRRFAGGYGFYGYPYANIDYVYAVAREQQYRASLIQAEQYRAALLQVQWAALQRAQAEQLRSRQPRPTPLEAGQPAPVAPARAPAAAPVVHTTEERAAAKLAQARVFAEDGQPAHAADYLRKVVQQYPGTVAAHEAQQSLDNASQR